MWSVFFVLLSYLDRDLTGAAEPLDAEKESRQVFPATFCASVALVGGNYLYRVADGHREVRSVVSPAGQLLDCALVANQTRAGAFLRACRRGGARLETPFARLDEAAAMCQQFRERSQRAGEERTWEPAPRDEPLRRSKRGFTYPGTLWCGAGNMADHYNQLGEFAETDSCCRVHDHCPHVIHAFSSKYGYTNFKWHSICHCDCDTALRECLRSVNDTASRVVGQAFFNVIGVPCFQFSYEERCVERHWYGLCKRYQTLPVAVLREAVPYDFGGIDVIDVLTVAPPKRARPAPGGEDEDEDKTGGTTALSGSQEPSLRNVVTAAEDFIKVLATVSTSQSSASDPAKGEEESSGKKKKRKKDKGKKAKSGRKRKGKGRKKKQKADMVLRMEEGGVVSPSAGKAAAVAMEDNFMNGRNHIAGQESNRVGESEYELGRREGASNQVMKDEPASDKGMSDVSVTSAAAAAQKRLLVQEASVKAKAFPAPTPGSGAVHHPPAARWPMEEGRRKSGAAPTRPLKDKPLADAEEDLRPSHVPATPAAELRGQNSEKRDTVGAASVKMGRSKEREDKKKGRRGSTASSIVAVAHRNSSEDNPALTESTEPSDDSRSGKTSQGVVAVNSASEVKGQRSGEKQLRGNRRKIDLSPPPPGVPAITPEIRTATEQTWPFTVAVPLRNRSALRQQRRALTKLAPSNVSFADDSQLARTPAPPKHKPVGDATPWQAVATSWPAAAATMSPMQLSLHRAREQFGRKKRRKAAMLAREPEISSRRRRSNTPVNTKRVCSVVE